ncbi:MAG TPA: DUF4097 family beta strand repeat-containing protein [Steroidobacteraceae bacterium]|nr:DUF4097 family beta strand repeat-containing protein [Steroidobacteraceae bacterium]
MRGRKWIVLLAFVASGMGPGTALALGETCEFRADRTGGADAAGVVKIVIHAGAGDLHVNGNADARRIDARGIACATQQALLDQAQVSVRREGNVVYVETRLPQEQEGWNWGRNEHAYIDLGVTLPANIAIEATDSSGDATFEDLKSLSLQDSSGDLELARIAGDVTINDSSGDLEIEKAGNVRVNDSSGDIDIDDVKTNVVVENDSSGDIEIAKVDGSVTIEQDSSGGIRVEDVRGSVTVNNDSSGDIYAGRVKGDFIVKSDSSGSIEHTAIGGKISVPRQD